LISALGREVGCGPFCVCGGVGVTTFGGCLACVWCVFGCGVTLVVGGALARVGYHGCRPAYYPLHSSVTNLLRGTSGSSRVTLSDNRVRRDGRFIERIGFYNPTAVEGEQGLRIAQDRLTYWKSVGAQASPTVERLIKQAAKAAA